MWIWDAAREFPQMFRDWHAKRAIRRAKYLYEIVNPLEPIEPSPGQIVRAVGILRYAWRDWYYLKERDGWSEDDYFAYADKLMKDQGIEPVRRDWL